MITTGSSGTSTIDSSYIVDNASYYVTTPVRKKREIKEKFMNFSVHTLPEYRKFMVDEYDVKKVNTQFYSSNLNSLHYFKKMWVTGLVFNLDTKKQLILEPVEVLCRLNVVGKSGGDIMFCLDESDLFTDKEFHGYNFKSKNLKKCFSRQEANEQYLYIRKKYEEKIDREIHEMLDFLQNISRYSP